MSAPHQARAHSVVRYVFRERVTHTVAALSYVYLLFTGLAMWTPALFWLAIVLGGGYLSRMLHPWVGIAFGIAVGSMYSMWRRDMRTTQADIAWRRSIMQYIRNEDDRVPGAGRFNFGQKQLFWLMAWGGAVLLVSGLVLWMPQWYPPVVRQLALVIHAMASLATIAGFIVHVYMGIAVVPGGLHAIVHGDVTEAWARHHHPSWADEVAGAAPAPRSAGASSKNTPRDAALDR
jgi:formate dehydrogenase subunit gamma